MEARTQSDHLTTDHVVRDIVNHRAFRGFGELMLPWEDKSRYLDTRLARVGSLMPYHTNADGDVVVGVTVRSWSVCSTGSWTTRTPAVRSSTTTPPSARSGRTRR
jgi:hypothetical protein